MRAIRVAAVQFEHSAGDKAANLAKIASFVEAAGRGKVDPVRSKASEVSVSLSAGTSNGVELIVFPECCITGYWFLRKLSREEIVALAEPVFEGASSQQLSAMAKKHNMTIGAGLVEIAEDKKLYNTYVVAMPDGKFVRHRKIHCFVSEHIASGAEYTVFDTPQGCRAAVLTCYDNNIVENARIVALKGAEVLLAPHQTGGCKMPSPQCMGLIDRALWDNRDNDPEAIEAEFKGPKGREWITTWLPARAHDNGMFLIFSNGVGVDDDEVRTGNSMIIDCYGRIMAETWKAGDDMVVAELDASLRANCTGARWIRSRRPGLYGPLTAVTGTEEDTRSTRFESKNSN